MSEALIEGALRDSEELGDAGQVLRGRHDTLLRGYGLKLHLPDVQDPGNDAQQILRAIAKGRRAVVVCVRVCVCACVCACVCVYVCLCACVCVYSSRPLCALLANGACARARTLCLSPLSLLPFPIPFPIPSSPFHIARRLFLPLGTASTLTSSSENPSRLNASRTSLNASVSLTPLTSHAPPCCV